MPDSSVAITAGSGTPIRVLTALGAGSAGQQVVTLGDSAGNLLGTAALPVSVDDFDQTATISIAANATASGQFVGANAAGTATIQLTGTFVATCQVQLTADGVTWVNVTGSNQISNAATGAYIASGNLTAVGIYQLDMAGFAGIRVITTAYTSGTVTGIVRQSGGAGVVGIEGVPSVTVASGTVTLSSNTPTLAAGSNAIGYLALGSNYTLVAAASTNAASIKTSAGQVYALSVSNPTATACAVKLYNLAAAPTVGTSVPSITITLAANSTQVFNFSDYGVRFTTGIAIAITANPVYTDTTVAIANNAVVILTYL